MTASYASHIDTISVFIKVMVIVHMTERINIVMVHLSHAQSL